MKTKTKSPTSNPRIVEVAAEIAMTQRRRGVIHTRHTVIRNETEKLEAEDEALKVRQNELQREMDKLAAPATVER